MHSVDIDYAKLGLTTATPFMHKPLGIVGFQSARNNSSPAAATRLADLVGSLQELRAPAGRACTACCLCSLSSSGPLSWRTSAGMARPRAHGTDVQKPESTDATVDH